LIAIAFCFIMVNESEENNAEFIITFKGDRLRDMVGCARLGGAIALEILWVGCDRQ
jgi:hypothetical protein